MRLLLIRHPAPAIAPNTCYGSSDIETDSSALADALMSLKPALLREAGPIHSSPLRRCTALASALHAAPPMLDARLAEMDFGAWELRAWDDIPRAEIDAWAADPIGYAPGGGETVLQVATRVADFLDELKRQREGAAIVVCHAGTIRLLTALHATLRAGTAIDEASIEAAALRAASTPQPIAYGSLLTLQF